MATKSNRTHTSKAKSDAAAIVQAAKAASCVELKGEINAASKRKRGQPTKFSQDKWERILEAVATYQDLIEICAQPDMPAVSTVYRWMRERPELKQDMRDAWEMFSYLGKSYNNNILRQGRMSTGDFRRDEALVADNRWFMAKTNRRDFGDRQQVDVTMNEPFVLDAQHLPFSLAAPQVIDGQLNGPEDDTPKPD